MWTEEDEKVSINICRKGDTMTDNIKAGWHFDNSYAQLPDSFYSILKPTPVASPELILLNDSLATSLGLDSEALKSDEALAIFAGNKVPEGGTPLAQAYAGHQFGNLTMLGDGRAILLGEQVTPTGERFDIQLKGAGPTPYSRGGDGRAGVGPMLREYIMSEAMHALGIPTTRGLAVVATGEPILREAYQQGAILTRVASSHLRVGTFQYAAGMDNIKNLRTLANYTLDRHFPGAEDAENRYLYLLEEVIKRQASLIAKWQLVGFIHGVMNTDNTALGGETIDYGPCAFMDTYEPATVFSSIDVQGRYAYSNQPRIAQWNLARFAETLMPLLHEDEDEALQLAQNAISNFTVLYEANWLEGMRAKLGIFNEEEADESLIDMLLAIMQKNHADFTNTFRTLTIDELEDTSFISSEELIEWQKLWQARLSRQSQSKEQSNELMRQSNPAVIPRNHRVEEALEAAEKKDFTVMENLLSVLSNPYAYSKEQEEYATLPSKSIKSYQTFCGT